MKSTVGRSSSSSLASSLLLKGMLVCMFAMVTPAYASKIIRTSAKSLAEKAGAAQYAVHIEEELTSVEIGNDRKQRASYDSDDNDSDYEIYQGVVGRPGIDFPIQASISQTTFNCAKFGNGYFADLETKCQVFHICEGGKKISFLCPNGTIFQQTDLICDWWFRVNCANSPDYYADSSEILSRPHNNNNQQTAIDTTDGAHNKTEARSRSDHKQPNGQAFTLRTSKSSSSTSSVEAKSESTAAYSSAERFDGDAGGFVATNSGGVQQSRGSYTQNRNQPTAAQQIASPLSTSSSSSSASDSLDEFAAVENFETQEVAETASFAKGQQRQQPTQYNSFLSQPIYVRSIQVDNNDTYSTNTRGIGSGSIQTNVNIINYLQAADRPPNVTKPASTVQPIYRRGSVQYSAAATSTQQANVHAAKQQPIIHKDLLPPAYTTPNQIPQPERSAKTKPRRLQKLRTASTQYYTPTVPSIVRKASTRPATTTTSYQTTAAPIQQTSDERAQLSSSEHAIEMMRILNELMLGNRLLKQDENRLRSLAASASASAAAASSSSAAEGRSLALYFATGEDNSVVANDLLNTKTPFESDTTNGDEPLADVAVSNDTHIANSLLSNKTIHKYDTLFGSKDSSSSATASPITKELNNNGESASTIDRIDQHDVASNSLLSISERTPAIRSLAQVFTHALSAYLHDPSTFRQVLTDIRPTEPPIHNAAPKPNRRTERLFHNDVPQTGTTKSFQPGAGDELEVLDFSDVTVSTQPTEISQPSTTPPSNTDIFADTTLRVSKQPRGPTYHHLASADLVPGSRQLTEQLEKNAHSLRQPDGTRNPLALEINGAFVVSTTFPYFQDDSFESMRNETIADPTTTQRFTQFYESTTTTPSDVFRYQTTTELTPSLDLDPTISPPLEHLNLDDNDLQRSASQSYLAADQQLIRQRTGARNSVHQSSTPPQPYDQKSTLAYTIFLDPLTINDELQQQNHQSLVTPSLHTYLPKSTSFYGDPSTTTTTELPTHPTAEPNRRRGKYVYDSSTAAARDEPPPMDKMQEVANEMFGNLNNTSAAHLMNVMRKANKNKTVRKLILLLIQTCDEDDSSTVEQSRTALLNALIGMDSKFTDENIDVKVIAPFKYRRGKSQNLDELDERFDATGQTATALSTEDRHQAATTTINPPTTTDSTYQYETSTIPFEASRLFDRAGSSPTTTEQYDVYTTESTNPPFQFDGADADDLTDDSNSPSSSSSSSSDDWSTTYRSPTDDQDEQQQLVSTTTTVPQTVPHSAVFASTRGQSPSAATLTTANGAHGTVSRSTAQSRQQSKRIVKDLDDLLAEGSQSYDPSRFRSLADDGKRSDTRALDLLKSLYALAGRLGK